jgi:hypothetical protein
LPFAVYVLFCKQWDGLLLTITFGVNAPEWWLSANHSDDEEKSEMKITRAGIDIAKSVFHVHAVDRHDRPQWEAKLKRNKCKRCANRIQLRAS